MSATTFRPITISTLRQQPGFAAVIAERCWTAWWQGSDVTLQQYRAWVDESAEGKGIPACFIAHDGDTYLGSCALIASDFDERPHLTPWIAALWVEEAHRRCGIASALMEKAVEAAAHFGHAEAYLCAVPEKTGFYVERGFTVMEKDVAGLTVFRRRTHP